MSPPPSPSSTPSAARRSWTLAWPAPPLVLAAVLIAFLWIPPVRGHEGLGWTLTGVACALCAWSALLLVLARVRGRSFRIEWMPVKSHYVQACVQSSILVYWGWYWPRVYPELPLVATQIVYLYALEALLSWSRGRAWRLGFGPLPIVISTNLLLWFKHDYYVWQYLMLTTGALAKQFITWNRDGQRTHIFNPSAFGQFLFAVVLIVTGTTSEYTWGMEIASFFDVPHMLVVIFLGGLVVQSLFHVTLMTLAATATLVVVNVLFTEIVGTYIFININIAAPIFLGLHLLVTDPATSPTTNIGRVVFGSLYGVAYAVLFHVLAAWGAPLFWDKLLPVPLLNLCVPLINRATRHGLVGRLNGAWERALPRQRLNLVHMGCWAAIFIGMKASGFIETPHPGDSIPFWKRAFEEGKPLAAHSLVILAGAQAEAGSAAAANELGLLCMEGKAIGEKRGAAAKYFERACELGDERGCANLVMQGLFLGEGRSEASLSNALDLLEQDCHRSRNGLHCFLVGFAHEFGRGRPADRRRAVEAYLHAGPASVYAAKGLARIALGRVDVRAPYDVSQSVPMLSITAQEGDAESCWYLAHMFHHGVGVPRNDVQARAHLERACALGLAEACEALKRADWPAYTNPPLYLPQWVTAFPN